VFEPVVQPFDVRHLVEVGIDLGEQEPDEARVTRVVLDQQDAEGDLPPGAEVAAGLHGYRCPPPFASTLLGSLTMVNQKSSIAFTTSMNWSRSMGFTT
jgi:hypothetical protein